MLIKTEGVVLKKHAFGESNSIVTLFSKNMGKIQAVSKTPMKGKGKYSIGTHPFCYADFILYPGKSLYRISQVDLKDSFYSLRENVMKLTYASYILELTESVIVEGQGNKRLFDLLIQWLSIFSKIPKEHTTLVKAYELKLLTYIGYEPMLKGCIHCGKKVDENMKFSSKEGGLVCNQCKLDPFAMKISKIGVNVMTYLIYADLKDLSKLKIRPIILKELNKIVKHYIFTHVGKNKFKSLEFLNALEELEK